MLVHENPQKVHELLQRIRDLPSNREPGLHVSDLIYCARKAWVRIHRPDIPRVETDDDTIIFTLGKGHHAILESGEGGGEHQTILHLNPELVHGTIDAMEGIPVEFKTTRASSRKGILEHTNYIAQLGAYCAATGSTLGRLYILYICGDYKPPKPVMKCYDFSFSLEELAEYSDELNSRAVIITDPDNLPPIQMHYSFECERCAIKQVINCPGGKGSYDQGTFHTTTPPWELQGVGSN